MSNVDDNNNKTLLKFVDENVYLFNEFLCRNYGNKICDLMAHQDFLHSMTIEELIYKANMASKQFDELLNELFGNENDMGNLAKSLCKNEASKTSINEALLSLSKTDCKHSVRNFLMVNLMLNKSKDIFFGG